MTLNAATVTSQTTDWIVREQAALDRLTTLIATNEMVAAYVEYLACRAMSAARQADAATAGITLGSLPAEPTTPTASLTATVSGQPTLLSIIASVAAQAVTNRATADSGIDAYQQRIAGG